MRPGTNGLLSHRLTLVLVASLAAAAVECSRADQGSARPTAADAGPPFDVETMAFLSKARALHHEANLREDAGDIRGAAAQIERIVRANRPHRAQVVPEVEEVLADAWARLAELDVRLGDSKGANDAAQEGLTHARGPSYFRGHLLEVQGIAEEAHAAKLADGGDALGAEKARGAAMRLLEEAVVVQDEVIVDALDAGRGEP